MEQIRSDIFSGCKILILVINITTITFFTQDHIIKLTRSARFSPNFVSFIKLPTNDFEIRSTYLVVLFNKYVQIT